MGDRSAKGLDPRYGGKVVWKRLLDSASKELYIDVGGPDPFRFRFRSSRKPSFSLPYIWHMHCQEHEQESLLDFNLVNQGYQEQLRMEPNTTSNVVNKTTGHMKR